MGNYESAEFETMVVADLELHESAEDAQAEAFSMCIEAVHRQAEELVDTTAPPHVNVQHLFMGKPVRPDECD